MELLELENESDNWEHTKNCFFFVSKVETMMKMIFIDIYEWGKQLLRFLCYLARLDTDYAVKVVREMIDMSMNVMTFELFFMTFRLLNSISFHPG